MDNRIDDEDIDADMTRQPDFVFPGCNIALYVINGDLIAKYHHKFAPGNVTKTIVRTVLEKNIWKVMTDSVKAKLGIAVGSDFRKAKWVISPDSDSDSDFPIDATVL